MLLAQSLGAWIGMVAPRVALLVLLTAFVVFRFRTHRRSAARRDFR